MDLAFKREIVEVPNSSSDSRKKAIVVIAAGQPARCTENGSRIV